MNLERLAAIEDGFDRKLSSDELAAEFGLTYASLRDYLRRRGTPVLHKRILALRQRETDAMRPYRYPIPPDPPRCCHGAWTTVPGECQHGQIQGKKS